MKAKKKVKEYLNSICASDLLLPVVRRLSLDTINVVYYHYVGDSQPYYHAFYSGCSTQRFTQDLAYLDKIFQFSSLNDVLEQALMAGNVGNKHPTIALTFDDGFNLYKNQSLIEKLDEYGIKATMFVITSTIGNKKMMWRHMLSVIQTLVPETIWRKHYNELARKCGLKSLKVSDSLLQETSNWEMSRKDELAAQLWALCELTPLLTYLNEHQPYMAWEDLERWLASGHSIGFHTHTHPYCSRLGEADLDKEFIEPALFLKQRLNINDLPLSYPFGDRLQPEIEKKLLEKNIFSAFYGIRGFCKKNRSIQNLERLGIENGYVSWRVSSNQLVSYFRK